jgi:hypothetical protein
MQKALMQVNVQLHHAVTDITGATGSLRGFWAEHLRLKRDHIDAIQNRRRRRGHTALTTPSSQSNHVTFSDSRLAPTFAHACQRERELRLAGHAKVDR